MVGDHQVTRDRKVGDERENRTHSASTIRSIRVLRTPNEQLRLGDGGPTFLSRREPSPDGEESA